MADKKVLMLTGVGILAVISLAYGILTPSKFRRQAQTSSNQVPAPTAPLAFENLIPRERHARRSEAIVWKKDPFFLEGESGQALAALVLDGIVWDEREPKAVINGKIVQTGDSLAGKKVAAIEKEKVVLTDVQGRGFELRLGEKQTFEEKTPEIEAGG